MGDAKIFGAYINRAMDYIKAKKGTEGLEELGKVLSREESQNIYADINPYPVETFYKIMNAVAEIKMLYPDNKEEKWQNIGKLVFNKVERLKHLTLEELLENEKNNWIAHHKVGTFDYAYTEGKTYFMIKDFPMEKSYCNFVIGYFTAVAKKLKLEDYSVNEIGCSVDGEDACRFEINWRPNSPKK